jgi:pSer/pThr/pTyr-binding forkhead associated (FHA) protein
VVGSNEPVSNSDKTNVAGVSSVSSTPKRDLNRTFIADVEETTTDRGEVKIESAPRSTRRIVGWIISYSLDPMGVDYRIFEGTNTIGRDSKNTIPITKDPTISGEHVIILYRNGKFKIKDKMTANGTFLNDVELEVEEAYDLGDGDVIRVGNTTFKFKSAES